MLLVKVRDHKDSTTSLYVTMIKLKQTPLITENNQDGTVSKAVDKSMLLAPNAV